MSDRRRFVRHPDDGGIDEILLCGVLPEIYDDAATSAFMRIGLRERYKTSGLSGDEWRFSTILQLREDPAGPWVDTSSGYTRLKWHVAHLYAELFGDFIKGEKHPWLYRRKVAAIAFSWKRMPVWSGSYDGEATDLLVAAGHLPAAFVMAPEQGAHPWTGDLCCQPGCVEPVVSVYRVKERFCGGCGRPRPYYPSDLVKNGDGYDYRAFCGAHLRRGDCALDDADTNYEVVSGPGPDDGEPDPSVVRESVFGGIVGI